MWQRLPGRVYSLTNLDRAFASKSFLLSSAAMRVGQSNHMELIGGNMMDAPEGRGGAKSQQADPMGLSFDSDDDFLNHANKMIEDGNRLLTAHKLDVAERYQRGEFDIHVCCTTRRLAKEFHLVFRSIPERGVDRDAADKYPAAQVEAADVAHGDWANDPMFVGVTEFVECPQGVIPSFVRLVPAYEVDDFFGQFFAPPAYRRFKMSFVTGEGEIAEFSALDRLECIDGLVKRGAQIVDSVGGDTFQGDWHGLSEPELMHLLRCVRINLDESGYWVSVYECNDLPVKVTDMVLCSVNAGL